MSQNKEVNYFKLRLGEGEDDSYVLSPGGRKLYVSGDQKFIDVVNFVEELNCLKPRFKKAWEKAMNRPTRITV